MDRHLFHIGSRVIVTTMDRVELIYDSSIDIVGALVSPLSRPEVDSLKPRLGYWTTLKERHDCIKTTIPKVFENQEKRAQVERNSFKVH